jgi:hypothetical protein
MIKVVFREPILLLEQAFSLLCGTKMSILEAQIVHTNNYIQIVTQLSACSRKE